MSSIISCFLPISIVLSPFLASAQDALLSGSIRDSVTQTPLRGAIITIKDGIRTTTDQQGHYQITVPKGIHLVTVSYTGYRQQVATIELRQTLEKDRKSVV